MLIFIETKAELLKKWKRQDKIKKLTFTLSLDLLGFGCSRFIMLFMVSSGWRTLFMEHQGGPVGN